MIFQVMITSERLLTSMFKVQDGIVKEIVSTGKYKMVRIIIESEIFLQIQFSLLYQLESMTNFEPHLPSKDSLSKADPSFPATGYT